MTLEGELGTSVPWDKAKRLTNTNQQFLLAFVESDTLINNDGLDLIVI
jgi:hypothetical protein